MHDLPTTVIGVMHAALRIPMCSSLKEKRSVLKPCLHYLQDHFKLAAAEVGDQDIWRSAIIAVAAISSDKLHVEQVLQSAEKYLISHDEFEVVDLHLEIL